MVTFINSIVVILFINAPLVIQLVLFPVAKLIFKNKPSHVIYTICFIINTILLFFIMEASVTPPENYDEPFDALDGLFIAMMWVPFYIGIIISCIVRTVKASKSDKTEDDDKNNIDTQMNSDSDY